MCKAQYGNIEGTFTVASKLTDVVTGKEDANFAYQTENTNSLLAPMTH